MSIETVLGILSLVGVLILGIGIIAWILVRKHFRVENIDKKNSEPATTSETSDAPIDPATIARIRNAIGATDEEEADDQIDELDEKGEMAIQRIAIAQNLQEAAGEEKKAATALKDSAKDLLEAEEAMMTVQMHRDVRIEEQNKNLEKEIAAKMAEIEAKAKLAREEILNDEKINLEKRQKALEEIARQKEIEDRKLSEWVTIERKRIDEQSKLDQKEAKRQKAEQDAELALAREREEAERKTRMNGKREETEDLINRLRLQNAIGIKKSLSFGQVMARYSLAAVALSAIIVIADKLF
jgi:hypothetical protein